MLKFAVLFERRHGHFVVKCVKKYTCCSMMSDTRVKSNVKYKGVIGGFIVFCMAQPPDTHGDY